MFFRRMLNPSPRGAVWPTLASKYPFLSKYLQISGKMHIQIRFSSNVLKNIYSDWFLSNFLEIYPFQSVSISKPLLKLIIQVNKGVRGVWRDKAICGAK
jgi:hypothetical protein